MKTMYTVKANMGRFGSPIFDSIKEAKEHILEDLQWIEENNLIEFYDIQHKIIPSKVDDNPKKELFRYFDF
tara:strand:+ start:653 stop:865 length:213 start_codon:yes stop_codon:yes gene_type:complete